MVLTVGDGLSLYTVPVADREELAKEQRDILSVYEEKARFLCIHIFHKKKIITTYILLEVGRLALNLRHG